VEHAYNLEVGCIIIIDHNLGYFERIVDQIGYHKGVLREVSEMVVGSLFGRRELNIKVLTMAHEFPVTPELLHNASRPFSSAPEETCLDSSLQKMKPK
jgi:hypothetical protein